jgi:hypothetical protein
MNNVFCKFILLLNVLLFSALLTTTCYVYFNGITQDTAPIYLLHSNPMSTMMVT